MFSHRFAKQDTEKSALICYIPQSNSFYLPKEENSFLYQKYERVQQSDE
jgi:hypothetical protein